MSLIWNWILWLVHKTGVVWAYESKAWQILNLVLDDGTPSSKRESKVQLGPRSKLGICKTVSTSYPVSHSIPHRSLCLGFRFKYYNYLAWFDFVLFALLFEFKDVRIYLDLIYVLMYWKKGLLWFDFYVLALQWAIFRFLWSLKSGNFGYDLITLLLLVSLVTLLHICIFWFELIDCRLVLKTSLTFCFTVLATVSSNGTCSTISNYMAKWRRTHERVGTWAYVVFRMVFKESTSFPVTFTNAS